MKIKLKIKKDVFRKKLGIQEPKEIDEQKIVAQTLKEVLDKIPVVEQETSEVIREKLEQLEGDERLDKKAIKGIEELEQKIEAKSVQVRGGGKGFQLYVDGSKKGLTVNTLNLIAGTGITLTHNHASGRNDITITAGSGALALITVSGTVDDSNTSFVAASTPQIVVINGAGYRNGKGVTISGTTITTDNPVGTGGDIYALG